MLIVVVLIAIFREQFSWIADLLIDPGSKVPDPSEIDVPVIN